MCSKCAKFPTPRRLRPLSPPFDLVTLTTVCDGLEHSVNHADRGAMSGNSSVLTVCRCLADSDDSPVRRPGGNSELA